MQAGYGRTGEHLWAFAHLGVEPDFVTLGKPMGNGYPVAAVITRRELVERFAFAGTVFSTFGGNPVAAQAALAVLDVIDDERIVENAKRVGDLLRSRIVALRHPAIRRRARARPARRRRAGRRGPGPRGRRRDCGGTEC